MSHTRDGTFGDGASAVLDGFERGDIDAHEAEQKLMDLGWHNQAIEFALSDRGSAGIG
jgi:hypothetical protein|tara:strand:+ start:105 stop:278 length:174 start_codon:yes stop_codon:yes gene_type:complete